MCGILVTAGTKGPFSHRDLASLKARGPDAIGFWSDGAVNVAQTRLAIIGLHDRSTGPIENDTHVLAYNGEIYNFEEVRRRLQAEGVPLPGANDAEVLLHAWTRWGTSILPELNGFWAFAVYDKRARTLSLVRDQLGIKPLYYLVSDQGIYVASMLRTILERMGRTPELDYEALSEYAAYQFTFGDKTFVRGLKKVLPGHIVEIDVASQRMTSSCYEDILAASATESRSVDSDWIDETRELLVSCVLESTISDTPFTTLCSGGIDSSLITRIAEPELAYHCNYSDPECNETFFARQVVEDTPTRLYVVNAEESFDMVGRLRSIVEDFDELTIGSVVLPLEDLLGQVKRRYKVLLTGTGGDELFGGYVRYQLAGGECLQDSYRGLFESMKHLHSVPDRFETMHRKGRLSYYRFFDPEVEVTFRKAYEACKVGGDDIQAMTTFDRRYFLPGLLNIDDKMSGRHSLESRPSLLHQRFVRHVNALDPSLLFRGLELKWVLRRIAATMVPTPVLQRSDKMGFTTPVGVFVQRSSDLIREQIMNSPFRDLYDIRQVNLANQGKFSREVFGLLMLDLWLNQYAA